MESREIQTLDHFHDDPHTVSCSDVLIDARGQEHALAAIGDPLPHLFSPSACYSSYSPSFAASSSTAAVRSTSFVASHPADETYDDDPGKPASFGTASRGTWGPRSHVGRGVRGPTWDVGSEVPRGTWGPTFVCLNKGRTYSRSDE